jgi:hypothetical protein
MEKTHWKKIVSDPNFIGEGDFQEGEEKVLTIDRVVAAETVVTAEGKSQKAVVHWREPGNKPMILNVARSKNIEKVAGSGYFEDWPGVQVQLYIEHGIKAFGEVVSAVRVRPFKPRVKAAATVPTCTDCGGEIAPAMGKTAAWLAAYTTKHYRVPLCAACAKKRKETAQNVKSEAPAEDPTPAAAKEEREALPWETNPDPEDHKTGTWAPGGSDDPEEVVL